MSATPQEVANYFLDQAALERTFISPMKLVKLVYIAYGWYIALTDKRLFDEKIEAWEHGPVVPSIYHEFKNFGYGPISRRSHKLDLKTRKISVPQIDQEEKEVLLILSKVWAAYRGFTAKNLSDKTHEVGSPWEKVFKHGERHITLKDDDIKEHYINKLSTYLDHVQAEKQ